MERIEEFSHSGKNFIYFDFSEVRSNDEFVRLIEESKPFVTKYAEDSLYTITNIERVRFDSKTKEMAADWAIHNKPYVKYGAVIGVDGIKKIMANAVFALSGRKNMSFASTKESAMELLLKQE